MGGHHFIFEHPEYAVGVFSGCSSLTSLDISSFDTSNVTDMSSMFEGCGSLTTLNLSNFNLISLEENYGRNFFGNCDALTTIYSPYNLSVSIPLPSPRTVNEKWTWQLSNGDVVTELPQNLIYSVAIAKNKVSEELPANDEMKYVQNLTGVSLANADADTIKTIQNAIYNLLFRAEYRPIKSDIPGDTMTFTGTWDTMCKWPIQNDDYYTQVFWDRTVHDSRLGTITFDAAAAGCMAYAYFASKYIYGTNGIMRTCTSTDTEGVKAFIRQYADPGEQLRYKAPHSIVFLGESADGNGFYYLSYEGGLCYGIPYHTLSLSAYINYADFASVIRPHDGFYVFDGNQGSYYSNTARPATDVRSGNGAERIVARIACPVEAAVSHNGMTLDSRSLNTADFGTVAREGEEIIFALDYAVDYNLSITGTGTGTMTMTLEYYDSNDVMIDKRTFVNVPISEDTQIRSGSFDSQAEFVLYVSKGPDEVHAWGAGQNESVDIPNDIIRGDNVMTPELGDITNIYTITFDANGGTSDTASMTTEPDGTLSSLPGAERDGYIFKGWYTSASDGTKVDEKTVYTQDTTLFAQWTKKDQADDLPEGDIPDGLWIAGINESGYSYTGEALKPIIRVYDKNTLLAEKTDYTIAYKNNKNVGQATITVTGKGNYSGKETATFNILPANLSGEDFYAENFYVKINAKKAQKPIPELYYMGTKLKNNKDFTITYSNTSGIYAQEETYSVTVTGKNNYTGTKTLTLTAVSQIPKKKPVSITKAALGGFKKTFIYTGTAQTQTCTLTVKTDNGKRNLVEGADYTVRYANNIKAGTATVTYFGKNGYSGKVKKTYKILPYDIAEDSTKILSYDKNMQCVYAKGGAKPKPVIKFDDKVLREGADYVLSYKNNKASGGSAAPCIIVTGKGSFKGKITINFTITPQDLSKMTLVSCDKVYSGKTGTHKITPKLMDLDGKLLSAGKDFDKNSLTYTYETTVTLENGDTKQAGSAVSDSDIIPADTQIRVTFGSGTGSNYTGTFTGVYRIVKADIKSAKVVIPNQIYTGKEITLDKSKITVTLSGTALNPDDYDIIQYSDNVKKGKASVTIKGRGNYGGMKTVKFTIQSKGFLWWWRKNN